MGLITAIPATISTERDEAHASLPHVLLVIDQLSKSLGGGERIVLKMAALLPQYGYRVSILTFFVHPECSVLKSPPPCPVYILPLRKTYDLTAMRAALEFRRFIREQKIRIVQTFFESSDIWGGAVVKFLSSAKLIWSRRDMGILRTRKHHLSYRLLASAPDRVFAVSEQVRRYCIETDGIDAGRVDTIYNGLELADHSVDGTSAKDPGTVLITTVGNIRHVKGHDVFIRGAAVVAPQFPQVSFSIGGEVLEPEYFSGLQELIRKLNLTDKVQFVGGVKDVPRYLSTADIFVLPSRSEGFSNAIIEAMAGALPVVATDVGGNAEAVEDGVNGFIVPSENPSALAEAMSKLLADPSMAKEMGLAGKKIAADRFTTDAMMNQITTVYAKLLA